MLGNGLFSRRFPRSWRDRHMTAAVILSGVAVLLVTWRGSELRRDWREAGKPPLAFTMGRTSGVERSHDWFSKRPREFLHGSFEFEVDGQTYRGTEFGRGGESIPAPLARDLERAFRTTGRVRIRYEPDDPSECYVELQELRTTPAYRLKVGSGVIGACVILWATLPLYRLKRRV